MTLRIVHLIDDLSPGGVTRCLDHLAGAGAPGRGAVSTVTPVRRGALRTPKIEADVIVSHLSVSWRTLPALVALRARYAHLPLIHVEHSYAQGFVVEEASSPRRFHNLLRVAYALFDRIVAVSRAQADWMQREDLVRSEAVRVISPTVDLAPFLNIRVKPEGETQIIGALGRFHRQKGFADLIAAFRAGARPDQRLRLIGDGPEHAALLAAAAGDERISFHPFTDDAAAAYAACDVIAVPSLWEPYGLVALEARAARRLVLAARVDGLADQIEEGCLGVAEGDWAAALAALPRTPPADRLAKARRFAVLQNHRFAQKWDGLLGEFETVAEEPIYA